jgi:hypothetical protein
VKHAFVALFVFLTVAALGCLHGGEAKPPGRGNESNELQRLDGGRLRLLGLTYDIPSEVRAACNEARGAATVRVICPRLIPDAPLSEIAGLGGGALVLLEERRFYMLDFNTSGSGPGSRRVEHWIVGAGQAGVVEKWVLSDFANEVKGNPRLIRRLTVTGRPVTIYRYPPYPAGSVNGSHTAAFVRVGDELVFASLHGRRHVEAAVAMAVDLAEQAARSAPAASPATVQDMTITYCGRLSVRLNDVLWLADPPAARDWPSQPRVWRETEEGTFVILSPERATFRTHSGKVTHFRRAEPGTPDPSRRCK